MILPLHEIFDHFFIEIELRFGGSEDIMPNLVMLEQQVLKIVVNQFRWRIQVTVYLV